MNKNIRLEVEKALKCFDIVPQNFGEVETKILVINVDFSNYDKIKNFIAFLKEKKIRFNSYVPNQSGTLNITILIE